MEPQERRSLRVSDAERDVAAGALADAVADGRLSLDEHNTRLDALYAAVTAAQLAAVIADLPARPVARSGVYRAMDPHRCVVIGGHAQRAGRFTIGRFCTIIAAFGGLDLDLRSARLSQEELTLTVWSVAARVTVIVPPGWRINDQVLVIGARRAIGDNDGDPAAPLLRMRGSAFAGSFHLSQV